ncbi:VanZ family protein [Mangrovimonas cancribranchiae]|uniref:VanZ family protein n=1 Tax=Mangrovimonas cancribranchiae TaxID=3080055 RepID=A0AAU6NWY5_9FLAO
MAKHSLLIAIAYTVVLTLACLISIDFNKVSDIAPSFSDKIFHFLAYALLTFLWMRAFIFHLKMLKQKAIRSSLLFSIIFGIIIEVLQMTLTSTRSFDFWDILSNTLGVLFTVFVLSKSKIGQR